MVFDIEDNLLWEILCEHLGEDESYMIYHTGKDSFLCSHESDGAKVVVNSESMSYMKSFLSRLESVEDILFVSSSANKPDFSKEVVALKEIWGSIYHEISDLIEDRLRSHDKGLRCNRINV